MKMIDREFLLVPLAISAPMGLSGLFGGFGGDVQTRQQ